MDLTEYFSTAVERETIRRKRILAGKWPWTEDPIFQEWRFCNVHRENDKTTVWFRVNIRNKYDGWMAVRNTFIFRWFTRIDVGIIIEDLLAEDPVNLIEMRKRLKGKHPVTTGAYIINSPDGLNKLDGIIYAIQESLPQLRLMYQDWIGCRSLEVAWRDLITLPYFGPFMAYEVVTDLRHTSVLDKAYDIMTWANAGPGCTRGLSRVAGKKFARHADQAEMQEVMRTIVEESRKQSNWPQCWDRWEMREAEHWACEYNKYCNAKEGRRLKRRYSHERT